MLADVERSAHGLSCTVTWPCALPREEPSRGSLVVLLLSSRSAQQTATARSKHGIIYSMAYFHHHHHHRHAIDKVFSALLYLAASRTGPA
jgi:hypothetical protein